MHCMSGLSHFGASQNETNNTFPLYGDFSWSPHLFLFNGKIRKHIKNASLLLIY